MILIAHFSFAYITVGIDCFCLRILLWITYFCLRFFLRISNVSA